MSEPFLEYNGVRIQVVRWKIASAPASFFGESGADGPLLLTIHGLVRSPIDIDYPRETSDRRSVERLREPGGRCRFRLRRSGYLTESVLMVPSIVEGSLVAGMNTELVTATFEWPDDDLNL